MIENTDRALVVLTTFWDANWILKQKSISIKLDDETIQEINIGSSSNVEAYSIALQHPQLFKIPFFEASFKGTLDSFCPTWDLLKRYHSDRDWTSYCKDYRMILKNRREDIIKWIENINNSVIYLLCCWENISGKSHCHRELIHQAFMDSKRANRFLLSILRSGGKNK